MLNVTKTLLFQTKLSKQFWSYALLHVAFLINRIHTPLLKNSTPYEKLYNKMYDLRSIKVFGCLCFAQTLSARRTKFDPRANAAIVLGFNHTTKGYVVFHLKTHEVRISRNVTFNEDVFRSCHNLNDNVVEQICLLIHHSHQNDLNYDFTCENSLTYDDNSDSVIDISCNNDTQDQSIDTNNIT